MRLGQFLIKRRAITPQQLWHALLVQQRSSPSDLEILDEILPGDDMETRGRILAHAASQDCSFLEAAAALGIEAPERIREATTRCYRRRPLLGQLLVNLSFVTREAMSAHLEEFFQHKGRGDLAPAEG